jgi:hypothetical protein
MIASVQRALEEDTREQSVARSYPDARSMLRGGRGDIYRCLSGDGAETPHDLLDGRRRLLVHPPRGLGAVRERRHGGFTDKLNGVSVSVSPATSPPTEASARSRDVPGLTGSAPAFQLVKISPVSLPAGSGVLIVFLRNSEPDPVTGRAYRDEVQEYEVFAQGKLVRMDLYGPVGADNVDAYRTMSTSLRIR